MAHPATKTGRGGFFRSRGSRIRWNPRNRWGNAFPPYPSAQRRAVGEPLRPEAVYRVATVDYAAEGGDGFAAFKKIKWQYTGRAHIECLRDYIAKAPVEVRSGGRITVLR